MKISGINRYTLTAAIAALSMASAVPTFSQTKTKPDRFEYSITPNGTTDRSLLKSAPSPFLTVMNKKKTAKIVVDISRNLLYKYDSMGEAEAAYRIASGKKSTPTHKGVRVVSHVETYPYRSAVGTKRKRNPRDYGPKVVVLNRLNPTTGEEAPIGEFIHGNRNASTLGMYVSHGCMRMDNEVIKQIAKEVEKGDIVIIK